MSNLSNDKKDRNRLRELAKKCAEISCLPETEEKIKAWTAHNRCEGYRPMISVQLDHWSDIGLPLQCTDTLAQYFEAQLQTHIVAHELVGDDTVTPPYIRVPVVINILPFGVEQEVIRAKEGPGYHAVPFINDLERDLDTLPGTTYNYDAEATQQHVDYITDAVGDILPVKMINSTNDYLFTPSRWAVESMTMQKLYLAMVEEPDAIHRLMQIIGDDMIAFLHWQEENGLLFLNSGNDFIASGSFAFTDELPRREIGDSPVLGTDIWGHINSQESVGISPAMYAEFVFPTCLRIAELFGLLYYGCCEPIDSFWDSIKKFPNLRKASISPWCNEEVAGQLLADSKIIYVRKASPEWVAWYDDMNEDAYIEHIKKTARLTRSCKTEYMLLDTCTPQNNPFRSKKAVDIIRRYGAYD